MKNIIFILLILLTSCSGNNEALSPALTAAIDSFIVKYPNWRGIQIMTSKLDEHDLLFLTTMNHYDSDLIDGYCFYKDKLITYYQTDSLDRTSIIDTKHLLKFNGQINNYKDFRLVHETSEPKYAVYEIVNKDKLSLITNESKLKFNRHVTGNNVIKNEEINSCLNSFIQYDVNVLYELRFIEKNNKQYFTLRSMRFYDKDKYDGYFYRNGYLVVLYGVEQSDGILDDTWIKKGKFGIPNFRYTTIKDWNYPYPMKFEILPNGTIINLPFSESFFI